MRALVVNANAGWQQRCSEKRQQIEKARQTKVARLRQDVERITKREIEFAKSVIETIVPVRIVWNEEAWQRLQETLPVKVEVKEEPVAEVVVEERKD